jgi:hypothetical protein
VLDTKGRNRGVGVGGLGSNHVGKRVGSFIFLGYKGGGWGTIFLSWEKENLEESGVKRSILTTFGAETKKLKNAQTRSRQL